MPKESIQRRSIIPSINYAIKVTVFELEKQLWETMNWELQKLLIETVFEEGKKICYGLGYILLKKIQIRYM